MLISKELLVTFSALQSTLISAFFARFPNADRHLFHGVPKHGQVHTSGESWNFQRHGQGVRFHHPETGRTVDAHRSYEDHLDAVDAWRILQFAESIGMSPLNERSIEESLTVAAHLGILRPIGSSHAYCLVLPE